MASGDIPTYLDADEDQQYADPERAAREVPTLAAVLDGEDNKRAADFRADAERLDRVASEYVPAAAARRLYDFARHHPAVVAEQAPTLVTHLDAESEDVRRRVAFAVMHAATEPESFVEYTSDFIRLLDDDDPVVRGTAAGAVGRIATIAPEEAVPAVGALVTLVGDPDTRADAAKALVRIGNKQPNAIISAAQPVCHHFQALSPSDSDPESGDTRFRASALDVIGIIALVDPEAIDDVSDALRRAMQSPQWEVRAQAGDTIGVLIVERPGMFRTLEPCLQKGLDDEEPRVRKSIAHAYLWIALHVPAAVDDPALVTEHLLAFDKDFENLPADDLERALQALDTVVEDDH